MAAAGIEPTTLQQAAGIWPVIQLHRIKLQHIYCQDLNPPDSAVGSKYCYKGCGFESHFLILPKHN